MTSEMTVEIEHKTTFANGIDFGGSGCYQRLSGRVRLAIDPEVQENSAVIDLDLAPRNAAGQVEFDADLCILRPDHLEQGNRRALFDFGNRGHKRALAMFNDAPGDNAQPGSDAGTGFLMRRGYSIVWVAWEGDILPGDERMTVRLPIASHEGEQISGQVRRVFIADCPGTSCMRLSGFNSAKGYATASRDTRHAVLTRRQYTESQPVTVPPGDWQFARLEVSTPHSESGEAVESAVVSSDEHIYLPGGFKPGWIYELVYTAVDPLVMGLGYVAVRDLISFLKYGERDSADTVNPLREGDTRLEKVYCFGRSQTGRVIRDFVYQGFNADGQNRRVFDGAFCHVAGAGRICNNHRWSQPVRLASYQHEDRYSYSDRFPFAYEATEDHLTGQQDGLLKRPDTDPLWIHTQTSGEMWHRHGSLVHTNTRGNDLAQGDRIRIYLWSSSQHLPRRMGDTMVSDFSQHAINDIVATTPLFRALLDHLDRWVTDGTPPPPSRVPLRSNGGLVSIEEWRVQFPVIPAAVTPREPNRLPLWDYGPDADRGYLTIDPPQQVGADDYSVLLPAVDADGNETAGIRMPLVRVPLGTATGWNIRARGSSPGAMACMWGSFIPFPVSRAERLATGDPRASIEERYDGEEDFLHQLTRTTHDLAQEGFLLLDEDLKSVRDRARQVWRLVTAQ